MLRRLPAGLVSGALLLASFATIQPVFAVTNGEQFCNRPSCASGANVCPGGAGDCRNDPAVVQQCGHGAICLTAADMQCLQTESCRNASAGTGYGNGATATGATICCACSKGAQRGFFAIPAPSTCSNAVDNTLVRASATAPDLQGIVCSAPASCTGPQLPADQLVARMNGTAITPTAQSMASETPPPPQPIVPTLGVTIPGLSFTPATINETNTVVPYLGQYIAALFRYVIGIVGLVATIMMVYGGFRYLTSSVGGSVEEGKKTMMNAVAGMLLALMSFAILETVNPDTLDLNPLNLDTIRRQVLRLNESVVSDDTPDGVNPSGCFGSAQGAATGGVAQTSNGYFVKPVTGYLQYTGLWRRLAYGPDLVNNQSINPCASATNQNGCIGTIGQGGCGPTSLAVILASYGLRVTDPGSSGLGTPDREQEHAFDPIDASKFAVRTRQRVVNGGTGAGIFTAVGQLGPYRSVRVRTAAEASQQIREGHLIGFLCTNCTVTSGNNRSKTYGGHYMVLHGVNADATSFRVFDVGGTPESYITNTELETHTQGMWAIVPTGAVTGNACAAPAPTNAPASQTSVSGNITRTTFTYRPEGGNVNIWPENQAQLLYPTALSGTSNPNIHAFVFIHGDNNGNTPSASANYTEQMQNALRSVAGSKNIVIMTLHHNGNTYPRLDINDFYAKAQVALQGALPGAHIRDVVVGGHSGATCNSPIPMIQAVNRPLVGQRGVIAFDGCLGEGLRASNYSAPTGQTMYFNPDVLGPSSSMGSNPPRGDSSYATRAEAVRGLWSLPRVSCPTCVATAGVSATCYGKPRSGGGEIYSFETRYGHQNSVAAMTKIAFCAFYQNDR